MNQATDVKQVTVNGKAFIVDDMEDSAFHVIDIEESKRYRVYPDWEQEEDYSVPIVCDCEAGVWVKQTGCIHAAAVEEAYPAEEY